MFNPWRAYRLWRHGRGFGVHSPLAYHVIKNVVGDHHVRYYYEKAAAELLKHLKSRDVKAAYRLISARNPHSLALICDNPERITAWLTIIASIVSEDCHVETSTPDRMINDADITIIDADKMPQLPTSRPNNLKGNWTIALGLNCHARRRGWKNTVQTPGYNAMTIDLRVGIAMTVRRTNLPHQAIFARL